MGFIKAPWLQSSQGALLNQSHKEHIMESPFSAYPALLHCGIHRKSINSLPDALSSFEQVLMQVEPPPEFEKVHCKSHMVSFARHLQTIIEDPIRLVNIEAEQFAAVLGVVVFHLDQDSCYSTALWQRPQKEDESWLAEFLPLGTPILDFPRTNLWQLTIKDSFIIEARQRINDPQMADGWANWAWSLLENNLISTINVRQLRSKIRNGLKLDDKTVRLMNACRHFYGACHQPSVIDYNFYRSSRDLLIELQKSSELSMQIGSRITLPESGAKGSTEATARFKQACLTLGIKPKQWRLIAAPSAHLLTAFKSFLREFVGEKQREPAEDFLNVIALLQPTKGIDTQTWRMILSIAGSRAKAPESYAGSLLPLRETLRHIIRLIETGRATRNRDQRNSELHEICAWLSDKAITELLTQQRREGWEYLVQKARHHAEQRQQALLLDSMKWSVPLHPVTVGEYTAVPLTCGLDLWEESVAMHHCSDLYGERCQSGSTLILSIRNSGGLRRATIAIERKKGDWRLTHAVGPANRQLGKEFDNLIDATLSVLNVVESTRTRSMTGPRYRIDVLDNYDYGHSWSENTFFSAEAALCEAKRICKSGLDSRNEKGRDMWFNFGETPLIINLAGAAPVDFDPVEYINKLFKLQIL